MPARARKSMIINETRLQAGDVQLNVARVGSGEPIVFLHGFPQYWYCWRHQMEFFAAQGYQAIAPDMRGYHESDKPAGLEAYRAEHVAADIVGLLDTLGLKKVALVGHDWGGIVAYTVAGLFPDRISKLAILNAPHPNMIMRGIFGNPLQLLRSWYTILFQLPLVPEQAVRRRDVLARVFQGWAQRPEAFSEADVELYARAMCKKGAAQGSINYYRAALRHGLPEVPTIEAPTLLLWGDRDAALGPSMYRGIGRHVADVRIAHLSEASHWVQEDEPDRVNDELLAFLKS